MDVVPDDVTAYQRQEYWDERYQKYDHQRKDRF